MNITKLRSSAFTVLFSALGVILGLWASPHLNLGLPSAEASAETLSTQSLQIVDASGRRRILMTTTAGGSPAVWFFDKNGKSRLNLGLYEDDNAFVVLNDPNEQAVQILRTVGGNNTPVLVMKSKGQDRMILGLYSGAASEPTFLYYDAQGAKHTVV